MSTPSAQIIVLNTILQKKELKILREVADSRTGAEIIQDMLGVSCNGRKKENALIYTHRYIHKTTMTEVCLRDTGTY